MSGRIWLLVSSLLMLSYGSICLYRYPIERQRAMAVPRMTCEQLIQKGQGAAEYVTLTDVRLCGSGFAFWRDAMSPSDVDVFIPVYPASLEQEPPPPRLKLLLDVEDSDDWDRIRESEVVELTCRVHAEIDDVDDWARNALAFRYPGLQIANLTVLTVGNLEPTMARAGNLLRDGIVACSTGVAALLAWLLWRRIASAARPKPGSSAQL